MVGSLPWMRGRPMQRPYGPSFAHSADSPIGEGRNQAQQRERMDVPERGQLENLLGDPATDLRAPTSVDSTIVPQYLHLASVSSPEDIESACGLRMSSPMRHLA